MTITMLKTKTITTPSCTLLVCELPEWAIPEDSFCDAIMYKFPDGYVETEYPIESDGSWIWQLINRLPEVTEEQAESVLPNYYHNHIMSFAKWYWALLFDFLKENEIYFDNPLGEFPSKKCMGSALSWQQAQSKVWDKERTFLFIKAD